MTVLPFDVLTDKVVKSNPNDRCYYCKNQVFGGILKAAKGDGFTEIMDGTNASDDAGDRPGMRALKEMKVLSPLRLSGITKTARPGIFPKCRIIHMEQARLRLSCDTRSGRSFHRSFRIEGCGMGREILSLILDSAISASASTRIRGWRRPKGLCAVVRKAPAHRGHDPEAYGAAQGDLRAPETEIFRCDPGSHCKNTVDVRYGACAHH